MKHNFYFTVLLFCILILSCYKPDDGSIPEPFIATSSSFSGYKTWKLESTTKGPAILLGAAHQGLNDSVTRKVYFKDGKTRVGSSYPIGTLIVKEATDTSGKVIEVTAMAKRGNNFNASAGNWEWFVLNTNGTGNILKDSTGIEMRGGSTMMGGMCNSCHNAASAKDFTFSK